MNAQPQYDLDVLLPVSAQGKYQERLRAFQSHGLLNASRTSMRLNLLVFTLRGNRQQHVQIILWLCIHKDLPKQEVK